MGKATVNVKVDDVQCDEIWGYVYKKALHKTPEEAHDKTIGDAYCFVAIERNSKLILNFASEHRDQATTDVFIERCGGQPHRAASRSPRMDSSSTNRQSPRR
jgi:hypothetical protein